MACPRSHCANAYVEQRLVIVPISDTIEPQPYKVPWRSVTIIKSLFDLNCPFLFSIYIDLLRKKRNNKNIIRNNCHGLPPYHCATGAKDW